MVIDGDEALQRAVRLGLFHLMASVADRGEAGSGRAACRARPVQGHVFWDSDVFVLPFLAATHPVLHGRCSSTASAGCPPPAQRHAGSGGGVRFPWESALDGFDVTPASAAHVRRARSDSHGGARGAHRGGRGVGGGALPRLDRGQAIRRWAGTPAAPRDGAVLGLPRPLRPWGAARIYGVIGPDEYHEPVDDNAFTNVMARWNLRRAAALPGIRDRDRGRTGWP